MARRRLRIELEGSTDPTGQRLQLLWGGPERRQGGQGGCSSLSSHSPASRIRTRVNCSEHGEDPEHVFRRATAGSAGLGYTKPDPEERAERARAPPHQPLLNTPAVNPPFRPSFKRGVLVERPKTPPNQHIGWFVRAGVSNLTEEDGPRGRSSGCRRRLRPGCRRRPGGGRLGRRRRRGGPRWQPLAGKCGRSRRGGRRRRRRRRRGGGRRRRRRRRRRRERRRRGRRRREPGRRCGRRRRTRRLRGGWRR